MKVTRHRVQTMVYRVDVLIPKIGQFIGRRTIPTGQNIRPIVSMLRRRPIATLTGHLIFHDMEHREISPVFPESLLRTLGLLILLSINVLHLRGMLFLLVIHVLVLFLLLLGSGLEINVFLPIKEIHVMLLCHLLVRDLVPVRIRDHVNIVRNIIPTKERSILRKEDIGLLLLPAVVLLLRKEEVSQKEKATF